MSAEFKLTGHRDIWIWAFFVAIIAFVFQGIERLSEFIDFVPFTVLLGIVVSYVGQKSLARVFPESAVEAGDQEGGWIERKFPNFWVVTIIGTLVLATYLIVKSATVPIGHVDRFDAFLAGPLLLASYYEMRSRTKLIQNRKFL